MEDNILQKARQTLTSYLEENKLRKTPERFAILDAIYHINGHFTLEELGAKMEADNFRVSMATLYNAINLFMQLRLVVRHTFQQGTHYEACFHSDYHCHEICTVCGKVQEVGGSSLTELIGNLKLKRFHPMGCSLNIYGVCSACHAKISRKNNRKRTIKSNSKKNEQR